MKKSRRWTEGHLKVVEALRRGSPAEHGVSEVRVGTEHCATSYPGGVTTIQTAYPPSANHSRRHFSRKLTPQAMEYQKSIGWLYRAAGGRRIDGLVAMEIELYKPAVKVPYDIDNALMNIFNGLKGIAYRDDDQVTLLTVAKMWPDGAGRAVIRLKKIAPAKAAGA